MATTATPSTHRPRTSSHSRTRSATIPSRPTTPLRPPSRTSLRASQTTPSINNASLSDSSNSNPLAALEPAFAELSDSMADLEANFMHLQLLHESLGRFTENFGAFLYGMNMSAFCVDFPEAPIPQSFARHRDTSAPAAQLADSPFRDRTYGARVMGGREGMDADATFLTTDTSFVENPPTSIKKPAPSKYAAAPASVGGSRQSSVPGRGTAATRGRAGGATGRGARGGAVSGGSVRGGSGIGRGGVARGRGSVR